MVALVVSVVLAVLKIFEWSSNRHRVHVVCRSNTVAIPSRDSEGMSNQTYVSLTVTTEGRPVSINAIRFELVGEAPDPSQGPIMGSLDSLIPLSSPGYPPTGFGPPVNLKAGASERWTISLNVPPFDYSPANGYLFRCTAELTNGKTFRSDPFWHVPSPRGGWSEGEIRTALGV